MSAISTPRKNVVLYHSNCTDGFGAALAAFLTFGTNAEYIPVNYGPVKESLFATVEDANVFILDFSFTKDYTIELMRRANNVTWLDHHKSAFDNWCGKDYLTPERQKYTASEVVTDSKPISCNIVLDNERSGALLAWDYFFPGLNAPILFKHLDDYDRWQFKLPDTKAFLRNLRSLDMTFEVWSKLNADFIDHAEKYHDFVVEGRAIDRYYWSQIHGMFKATKRPIRIQVNEKYYDVFSANVNPCFTSDVGHLLAEESGTFGLCWYWNKHDGLSCSLRSVNGFDVSEIAQEFDGGGHKSAAGFSVPYQTLHKWLYDGAHKDDEPVGLFQRLFATIKKWAAYF